jgi:hypothetical protein
MYFSDLGITNESVNSHRLSLLERSIFENCIPDWSFFSRVPPNFQGRGSRKVEIVNVLDLTLMEEADIFPILLLGDVESALHFFRSSCSLIGLPK